jgi:hypothetical protein
MIITNDTHPSAVEVTADVVALVPVGGRVSAPALSAIVAAPLVAATLWELRGATWAELSRTSAPVRSWETSPGTQTAPPGSPKPTRSA